MSGTVLSPLRLEVVRAPRNDMLPVRSRNSIGRSHAAAEMFRRWARSINKRRGRPSSPAVFRGGQRRTPISWAPTPHSIQRRSTSPHCDLSLLPTAHPKLLITKHFIFLSPPPVGSHMLHPFVPIVIHRLA